MSEVFSTGGGLLPRRLVGAVDKKDKVKETGEWILLAGKEILRREHEHFRDAAIDDARHIPRIQRIALAVAETAREAGAPDKEAEDLRGELVAYGRKLWLDLCMENLREDDVDPDAYREESREIVETIRTADDPWSVYR